MDRLHSEMLRLGCPLFADEFVRCQGIEPSHEIVGINEVSQMLAQLSMVVVMEAFYGGLFDCPVHPFNLSIDPRVLYFGEVMLNSMLPANSSEDMRGGI